jgi:hypothetical protein
MSVRNAMAGSSMFLDDQNFFLDNQTIGFYDPSAPDLPAKITIPGRAKP